MAEPLSVQAPVLLVHGDRDTTVPVADAYELHSQAPGDTQLVIVKGANHTSIGASIEDVTPLPSTGFCG